MKIKIEKTVTIDSLIAENASLATQIELCNSQEQAILSVSTEEAELSGVSYETIEERIHKRPFILNAHAFAYNEILDANMANIILLTTLPNSLTPGVLDTEECDQKISELEALKTIARSRSFSPQYSIPPTTVEEPTTPSDLPYRCSDGNNYTPKLSYATPSERESAVKAYYAGLIATYDREIEHWEGVKEAANQYNELSKNLYVDAKNCIDQVLSTSTDAVNGCIANGEYGEAAFSTLLSNLVDYRVNLAKPYLNDDELAAYREALRDDGMITHDEIYNGKLNEKLYTALAMLPDKYVQQKEVDAIADAYNNMWCKFDTDAIERFLELSYVIEDIWLLTDAFPAETITPEEAANHPGGFMPTFRQASLLGRVSESAQSKLRMIDKNDTSDNYHRLLAGANMLNLVANENHLLTNNKLEVEVELGIIEAKIGKAVISNVAFNPYFPDHAYTTSFFLENFTDTKIDCAFSFTTFTGNLNALSVLMEDERKDENIEDDFNLFGFFAKETLYNGVSKIPLVGDTLSSFTSLGFALHEHEQQKERNNAIRKSPFTSIAAFSENPVLKDLGFAFNARTEWGESSDFTTNAELQVYLSNDVRDSITEAINAYNDPGSTYGIDNYISHIESNPYRAIVPNRETLNKPPHTEKLLRDLNYPLPDKTQSFIYWCGLEIELVDEYGGEATIKGAQNYEYYAGKEGFNERGVWAKGEK